MKAEADSFIRKVIKPEAKTLTRTVSVLEEKCQWVYCCIRGERDTFLFMSKLYVSTIVLLFSCYQLAVLTDCASQHMYSAIIGTILGTYLKL